MSRAIDMSGEKYGRLTCLQATGETTKNRSALWLCICDCGNMTIVSRDSLRKGNTRSCGCLFREINRKKPLKHGLTMNKERLRLYNIWSAMKARCQNPNNSTYHSYGGRGIKVCDEWLEFKPFYEWAISNGYNDGLTIDRRDNNGNYEPSNYRWVTPKEQSKNTRRNHPISYNGQTKLLSEWSKELGIDIPLLIWRLRKWGIEKALTTPIKSKEAV
ncbi:MAG: AP2 domain-containing protein [Peptococcaceae bacterium]|nr:AP2 domain-containing protein [Peptococcaceae bacterium]